MFSDAPLGEFSIKHMLNKGVCHFIIPYYFYNKRQRSDWAMLLSEASIFIKFLRSVTRGDSFFKSRSSDFWAKRTYTFQVALTVRHQRDASGKSAKVGRPLQNGYNYRTFWAYKRDLMALCG